SPKSSIFDIMKTLVYKNMVIEDNQSGITKYKIGLQSFLIGSSYLNDTDIVNIAKNDLIDLANRMQATTFMSILDDDMVTYLYKYESEKTIITTANIGSRRSIHSSALGKVMVAFGTDEDLKRAIQRTDFVAYTEYTITSVEKYLDQLKEVRIKGYAKSDREDTLQQVAAAAPIRNHDGKVIAAISCVGFYESQIDLDDLGLVVKDVADKISVKLGYTLG
ncbi:IclR family transcriptional regulator, partial [Coprobacillus cateniformis]|nr:IclR family transcriptional regulator [Coprobacillus cateniformis]